MADSSYEIQNLYKTGILFKSVFCCLLGLKCHTIFGVGDVEIILEWVSVHCMTTFSDIYMVWYLILPKKNHLKILK